MIVSSSFQVIQRWNARRGEQIGDDIEVPRRVKKIALSNDGENIACRSESNNYFQKWEIKTRKTIYDRIKWSKAEHMLG